MVLVDVTRMHIPFMTPDEALNSVSHAPVINFLAPNLVGILFRVCELLHELWRPECSFVGTAAQELGGHNSDYVSHNSLLDRVTHAHTPRKTCSRLMRHDPPRLAQAHRRTQLPSLYDLEPFRN